jgi:predicted metalloendopeptidase
MMSDLVGLIFSYEVVTSDVSEGIRNMTVGIQSSFNTSLPSLDWLDTYSLDDVIFKLDHVEQIIGHSNVMDKYLFC